MAFVVLPWSAVALLQKRHPKLRNRKFELLAEPRVGFVRVDALGAAAPFSLVRAPPVGLEGFLGAVLAHFERLEDLVVRRRGPSLLANFHQLGLAVAVLTNKS